MKKIVLVIFALFLGFGINAQSFGLRAGYQLSGLRINDLFADHQDAMGMKGKLTNGMNIGFIFEKAIKPKFIGHAELNFTQKGSAYDMTANDVNNGTSGHGQTNLNYLELALMAKFRFGPAYVGLGPFFDYLVSAKEIKYRDNPNLTAEQLGVSSLKNDEYFDMDMDLMNRFDFGGHLSIGAQFPVGPVDIFGEARGNMSFLNWEDSPTFEAAGFEYKRNLAFTFSIGILFNKPSK